MPLNEVEAMALIAESIRRTTGVTVGDEHLGVAFAMLDQIYGQRKRQAATSIRELLPYLPTRQDRVLAAAFPAIFFQGFRRKPVTVVVSSTALAQEDARLYSALLQELQLPKKVVAPTDQRQVPPAMARERPRFMVAALDVVAAVTRHEPVMIARLSPDATSRLAAVVPNTATLPDP